MKPVKIGSPVTYRGIEVGAVQASMAKMVDNLRAIVSQLRAATQSLPRSRVFWYMSVVGSLMTLSYFLFSAKQDSVGVLQNLFPAFTALYSLYLDIKHRGWHRDKASH